jgi:hypothetical protein
MEFRNRIYHLLLNEQAAILEILQIMGIKDSEKRIKNILDEQLFEVLECSNSEILKIKIKATGEILEKGGKFYHKRYEDWFENICFDESLFGVYCGKTFYKNYIRAGYRGGLYHLDEISLTDKTDESEPLPQEIVLNGITYIAKKQK